MTQTFEDVLPQSGNRTKVEHYGWKLKDQPGEFQWVEKTRLQIDHAYQRDKISDKKVLDIARNFSWAAFNTLSVARRPDGSLFPFDGQHRWLGSCKRSDVEKVPCMIFDCDNSAVEADRFITLNCTRTGIPSANKFKAMVHRCDPDAIAVSKLIEEFGYSVSSSPKKRYTVGCIMAILTAYQQSPETATDIWKFTAILHDGEKINDRIWLGLFHLERELRRAAIPGNESLLFNHNQKALHDVGLHGLKAYIDRAAAYYTKGGPKVYAKGILNCLNVRRKSRRIPEEVLGGRADQVTASSSETSTDR